VSLVGVDKAQAAQLTYNFQLGNGGNEDTGFFKVNNSSLTGIGLEEVAVSEGRFYDLTLGSYIYASYVASYDKPPKEYYNLAGATALFYQGNFRGLQASGEDTVRGDIYPGLPYEASAWWFTRVYDPNETWSISVLTGFTQRAITYPNGSTHASNRRLYGGIPISYTLVNTEAEPVPEPLTAGGTALALAGLSWLKQKKKMAA
jgi:hypothetical protein